MVSRGKGRGPLNLSVGFLTISTGRISGSFLLAVYTYSSTRTPPLISSTTLGVLLVFFASLLSYVGFRKSLQNTSLVLTFTLSVSALWWGVGMIHILDGQGILIGAEDMRNAMVPGLASFALGFFIIGVVGVLQDGVPIALMAFAITYSCVHGIAIYCGSTFGSSAVACNYLIVTIVSLYLVAARVLHFLSKRKIALPGAELPNVNSTVSIQVRDSSTNDAVIIGLIVNIASSSVFGCRILGLTTRLFVGQVPWVWMAGFFQIGVCILSYRSFDTLMATFFGFSLVLRFAEGYSLLYRFWQLAEPIFPVSLLVVFAILFFVLAMFMALKSLGECLYLLLFVAYCISMACCSNGFFNGGAQGVSVAIYVASTLLALAKLYNMNAANKIPLGERIIKDLLSRISFCKLRQQKDLHSPYLGYSKYANSEVLGHACSVLAAFAITMAVDPADPRASIVLPWVVVAGGILKLVCGSVAFSRGKTLESCAFLLYGVMWIIWGLTRYGGLYGPTRGFHVAVGIICLMLFNAFIIFCTLFLSKAWFLYCLTFELILISFLLDALSALPVGYDIAVTIIFGLVSFYCFLSGLLSSTFEEPQLPMGEPLVKLQGFGGGSSKCPLLPAWKSTSIKQVAGILKSGGICAVPSDAGYVMVAACNQPEAVQRLYRTISPPQKSLIEMWISSLRYLEPTRTVMNSQIWDLMQTICPYYVSVLLPRGEWLNHFGLKESEDYFGTAKSISIRIPDCSVTTYLIDLVGPIIASAANPTEEVDTIYHHQFLATLGNQVDAILWDGPSLESAPTFVIDGTKIGNGVIGISGNEKVLVSEVYKVLEEIQRKNSVFTVTSSSTDMPNGHDVVPPSSSIATPQTHPRSLQIWYLNKGFSSNEDERL